METTGTNTDLTGLRVFISYPRGGLAHTWAKIIQQDLEARGAAVVWRDEIAIEVGDQHWLRRIEEGLEQCDILAYVLTDEMETSDWVTRELLTAQEKSKPIVILRVEPVPLPHIIKEKQPVDHQGDQTDTMRRFTDALFREWRKSLSLTSDQTEQQYVPALLNSQQRQQELNWLDEIIYINYSDRADRYVELVAEELQSHSLERALKSVHMETQIVLEAFGQHEIAPEQQKHKIYPDVLQAYREFQTRPLLRLAVLGDPGAGKSFSLERIALEYAKVARKDTKAPIPLLVQLGRWTREGQSLEAFIESTLGELGRHFNKLKEQGRAVLLLDAMNEIPPGQRRHKAQQIQHLEQDERFSSVVVSCRARDYESDFQLPFDTLTLQPLTPSKIREFLWRVLSLQYGMDAKKEADARFWQIAGGKDVKEAWLAWQAVGCEFDAFLNDGDISLPLPLPWYFSYANIREKLLSDRRSLLYLASNPYMLQIMAVLPELPKNRARLFSGFLQVLYEREKSTRERRQDAASVPNQNLWLVVLGELAEAMQFAGATQSDSGAQTVLMRDDWPNSLTEGLLDFSCDASVLQLTGDDLRFTHQLLQEYLASQVLIAASQTDPLLAEHYWPGLTWWQGSGWEVVAEIAAEALTSHSIDPFIAWLARSNLLVAANVWALQDLPLLSDTTRKAIHDQWLSRMTDSTLPPRIRAYVGLILEKLGLDDRPGVGLKITGLPDIDWVEIPAGAFIYGKGNELQEIYLDRFSISRYPITSIQYQAFIDAGGYDEKRWWKGLNKTELADRDLPDNLPETNVNWREAVAYTRWLANRFNQFIRLPTEQEWEKAARGTDARLFPWGKKYQTGYANVDERHIDGEGESLEQPTAVGLFPDGQSPYGVMDMAGNIWEWCLNKYNYSESFEIDKSGDRRVLRGGSWFLGQDNAHTTSRFGGDPDNSGGGFRVLLSTHQGQNTHAAC